LQLPPGFTQLFPYLFVEGAEAYLKFLVDGLGGQITNLHRNPDHSIANAHVVFGDTTIMVSEARDEFAPTQATYYLYVENADAATGQAEAAGATIMFAPVDMSYGDRQSGVRDSAGNVWWLSQRLASGPY
jgi:PhnB protein